MKRLLLMVLLILGCVGCQSRHRLDGTLPDPGMPYDPNPPGCTTYTYFTPDGPRSLLICDDSDENKNKKGVGL